MGKVVILAEGMLFLVIGLIGMIEGFRLTIHKDPMVIYDLMGPGLYVLVFSIALMIVGVAYTFVHYRKPVMQKTADETKRVQLFGSIGACVLYIILINVVGYLIATAIFLFVQFKVVGVKFWPNSIILTLLITFFVYIVFIKYCEMVFPRGIIFR